MKNNPIPPLAVGLAITLAFFIAGLAIALTAGSLALLGDAFHNLSHASVIGFSLWGIWFSAKSPTPKFTYGFRRLEFLVPIYNIFFLILVALWLIMEGRNRLAEPSEIVGLPIIAIAALDIASNVAITLLLRRHFKDNTVKTLLAHLSLDALISFAVIFAGLAIHFWNWYAADAWAAMAIGAFVLISSPFALWNLSKELLEGVPPETSFEEILKFISEKQEVLNCHDLHISKIGKGEIMLTAHITLTSGALQNPDVFLQKLSNELRLFFNISHSTIQAEQEECLTKDTQELIENSR